MVRDLLGNGKGDRIAQALKWLDARRSEDSAPTVSFGTRLDTYVDQLTGVAPPSRGLPLTAPPLPHRTRRPATVAPDPHPRHLAGQPPQRRQPRTEDDQANREHALDLPAARGRTGPHDANPCRRVRLPQQSLDAVGARFLTHDEARTLLEAIPERYRPLVVFLLGTEMRWSEATAIEDPHVDLAAGTVRVQQAWKRVPGQGIVIGPPEDPPGPSHRQRRHDGARGRRAAATPPDRPGLTTVSGNKITHANFFNNVWKPACARAGFDPAPRIHDLRHTHASWLISDGITLEAVQDQLGHESIETTRRVYAQLVPAIGVAVGRAASAALQRTLDVDRHSVLEVTAS